MYTRTSSPIPLSRGTPWERAGVRVRVESRGSRSRSRKHLHFTTTLTLSLFHAVPRERRQETAVANVPSDRQFDRRNGRKCSRMFRNVPECAMKKIAGAERTHMAHFGTSRPARALRHATPRYRVLRDATVFRVWQNQPTGRAASSAHHASSPTTALSDKPSSGSRPRAARDATSTATDDRPR